MGAFPLRRTLKTGVEHLLVALGADRAARTGRRGHTLVLAYHNVIPAGERPFGDRSLHLPQADFACQLDALARTHDVVPLDAIERSAPGGRPRAVITFDDAYRGALTAGCLELERRRLPATVFVAPGILGDRALWWDVLASSEVGLDPAFRDQALTECRGLDAEVRALAARQGRPVSEAPSWARTVTESELGEAVGAGLRVASHSWGHANLAALGDEHLDQELAAPGAWLRDRHADAYTPYVAYPYGLVSPAAEAAARRAGYARGFLVSGGYATGAEPPFRMPRLNVPAGISDAGFALRAAGIRAR